MTPSPTEESPSAPMVPFQLDRATDPALVCFAYLGFPFILVREENGNTTGSNPMSLSSSTGVTSMGYFHRLVLVSPSSGEEGEGPISSNSLSTERRSQCLLFSCPPLWLQQCCYDNKDTSWPKSVWLSCSEKRGEG